MRISSAQPIRRMDENGLDAAFRCEVPNPFETGTNQSRPAIAFVFKNPFGRNVAMLFACKGHQRRGLTGDRMLFLLPVRRNPSINRGGPHRQLPSLARRRQECAPDRD